MQHQCSSTRDITLQSQAMPSNGNQQKAIPSSMPGWERRKRKRNDQMREEEEQRASKSTRSSRHVLPNDILYEVLFRLPVKYLLRFRSVSKYWFQLLTDPRFVEMYLKFHTSNKPPLLMLRTSYAYPLCQVHFDDDKNGGGTHGDLRQQLRQQQMQKEKQQNIWLRLMQFWGSCNGLMCMELYRTGKCKWCEGIIWLWNPCTKEFKELVYQPMIFPDWKTEIFGFGYDITTHDYKVIRNSGCYHEDKFLHTIVEVYTLGTDSWKVIGKYPYEIAQHHIGVFARHHIGVFANGGGVYWLARRQSIDMIICFDITNEDYKEISSPPSVLIKTVNPRSRSRSVSFEDVKLTELKGNLCIINPIVEQKCLEVWEMNEEESNWSKLFIIREPITAFPNKIQCSFELLGNYKNNGDEILVLVNRKELVLYNPKNDSTRALIQMDDVDEFKVVRTCTESPVSLNTGTYACTIF